MSLASAWSPVSGATCVYGCPVAEVDYTYVVDGETYPGIHEKGFICQSSGKYYARLLPPGKEISVRVKPAVASVSIILDDDQSGLRGAVMHTPHPDSMSGKT